MKSILKMAAVTAGIFLTTAGVFGQGVVSTNGLLKVNGNKIENKNGTAFSVAGNSMFWSGFQNDGGKFYQKSVVDHLATEWNSGVIRAAMAVEEADGGQGYVNNPTGELAKVETIIDAAIANDIYVLVDFHSHFAHVYEDEAIDFFTKIATKYKDNDHIIYEIFNEPISIYDSKNPNEDDIFSSKQLQQQSWDDKIKPYAINVINAIRAIDKDNMIIVGTPGFSQFVDAAAANRITRNNLSIPADAELNIAYTLHFYSGTHKQFLRNIAQSALTSGIALFVTEWGTVNADGDGSVDVAETKSWFQFMKQNNISNANWSISDKAEGASVIQAGQGINGLTSDNLTASGEFVKCLIESWDNGDFSSCSANDGGGNPTNPVGGTKIEVESALGTTSGNARVDFISDGLSTDQTPEGEGVRTGFKPGEAISFNLPVNGNYTFQVLLSSTSGGHTLEIQRDAGTISLASKAIPNTGGLNNYQVLTISGIPFSTGATDFAIAIGGTGSGTINIDSITYLTDEDFLNVEDFDPIFNNANLYPNPANNEITIDFTQKATYTILDISGKTSVDTTEFTGKINVSDLADGFYLLQLNVDGKVRTYKFVKE